MDPPIALLSMEGLSNLDHNFRNLCNLGQFVKDLSVVLEERVHKRLFFRSMQINTLPELLVGEVQNCMKETLWYKVSRC